MFGGSLWHCTWGKLQSWLWGSKLRTVWKTPWLVVAGVEQHLGVICLTINTVNFSFCSLQGEILHRLQADLGHLSSMDYHAGSSCTCGQFLQPLEFCKCSWHGDQRTRLLWKLLQEALALQMRQWPKSCLRVQGVAYAVTESINETALENRPEETMQIFSSVVSVWFFEMNRWHK